MYTHCKMICLACSSSMLTFVFTQALEMLHSILSNEATHDILLDIGLPIMHKGLRLNCRVLSLNGRIILVRYMLYVIAKELGLTAPGPKCGSHKMATGTSRLLQVEIQVAIPWAFRFPIALFETDRHANTVSLC